MSWSHGSLDVVVVFAIFLNGCHCQSCPPQPQATRAITRLRQNLLCGYDHLARPVKNNNVTVSIFLTFDVSNIRMDEDENSLNVEGVFHFVWVDQYLTWKPSDYEGLSFLKLDGMAIWLPDVTINLLKHNGVEDLTPTSCVGSFRGMVACLPKVTVEAPCTMNMRHWPFDEHNCTFYLSSYMHYENMVNLSSNGIDKSKFRSNRVWDITKLSVTRAVLNFSGANSALNLYPVLEYNFIIRRHAGSYSAAVITPAFMMLTLVLSTFWMGPMVNCRIYINGFVLLGCVTFLNYLLYLIPSNGGDIPVIIILFRDCLSLSAFATFIAVMVKLMTLSRSQPHALLLSVSNWLELSIVGRVLFLDVSPPPSDDEAAILETPAKASAWAPCAILLDRVAFCITFIIVLILSMGYLP